MDDGTTSRKIITRSPVTEAEGADGFERLLCSKQPDGSRASPSREAPSLSLSLSPAQGWRPAPQVRVCPLELAHQGCALSCPRENCRQDWVTARWIAASLEL